MSKIPYLKKYEELFFTDDFLFCKIMQEPAICTQVIQTLLGFQVEKIEYIQSQREIKPELTARGIRLDVYVRSSDAVIDIEMQTYSYGNLPLRMRYYQSLMDIDFLEPGRDFSELNNTYIVFICTHDPFGKGLPVYTIKPFCVQSSALNDLIDDKTVKAVYNVDAWQKVENPALRSFLHFLKTKEAKTPLEKAIESRIVSSLTNQPWRKEFMICSPFYWDAVHLGHENGFEEGIRQGILQGKSQGLEQLSESKKQIARNLKQMGLTGEQIAQATGLDLQEVALL